MDGSEKILERLLVLRCQMGDSAALEELFARYDARIGYYLRRLLSDAEMAADAQQETWVKVVRGIRGLKEPEAFAVWLYRIARSKAIDQLNTNKRFKASELDVAAEELLNAGSAADEELPRADAERIHAELEKLSPRHREVLTLRFLEDLPYEQMAQVVGCTVGTVRSRLHYAKLALRRRLENEYERVTPER